MQDTTSASPIGDTTSDSSASDPSPCSTYETANIPSVRVSSSTSSKSVVSTGSGSTITPTPPAVDPVNVQQNLNYVAYPISKSQLSILLMNDLQQRREAQKVIDQRLIDDEKIFREIETTLFAKIEKYHQRNNTTLVANGSENINIEHINQLLDRIIQLNDDAIKIKKAIRKKKWYDDRNALYRKISENHQLMNDIDSITQKIDYWQQMIMAGMVRGQVSHVGDASNHKTPQSITPFVVKEALRIRAENEETLNCLRNQLDEIRA
eukprot:224533_1